MKRRGESNKEIEKPSIFKIEMAPVDNNPKHFENQPINEEYAEIIESSSDSEKYTNH